MQSQAFHIHGGGWAELNPVLIPDFEAVDPSLRLGLPTGSNAQVYRLNESGYWVVSEAVPGDKVILYVESYRELMRVLADLSSIIGGDLATRMHTDLQAQIEDANAQVAEVIKEHTARSAKKPASGKGLQG